jgi:ribosomal protein S18 acetylase RimI-like enzyme
MESCLETVQGSRGDTIWLGVWEHNDRAIRFYERWGFEIVGEKQFVLGGEKQCDVVMSRHIDDR